jgi:hypothetical protein
MAETTVKMSGDARVYGVAFTGHNFTGFDTPAWTSTAPTWSRAATRTEETFDIWERVRVRSDFSAGQSVKFRLALRVEDTWGHGIYTAANPTAGVSTPVGKVISGVQVYEAYLKFNWPDTDIRITAGLQELDLPQSQLFYSSIVFGGDRAASLVVTAPIVADTLRLTAGFSRFIDSNRTYDAIGAGNQDDELDGYWLTLPITVGGFKASPWGLLAVAGRSADYYINIDTSFGYTSFAENLLSSAVLRSPGTWKNSRNPYIWGGSSFEVTALEPLQLYADVIYGSGAPSDRQQFRRRGWFLDLGAEYTGWSVLTPRIFAWWSSGEDASWRNGSERIAILRPSWAPGNSFLFDGNQEFGRNSNMGMNPVGAYGIGASLGNIALVTDLTQRLTFTYLHGNNSPRAIRGLNAWLGAGDLNAGTNPYFVMGRDLTDNEYAYGMNFDSKYKIYENLAAIVETGWAHGHFQESVWGRRLVRKGTDAFRVAFGLAYKF